jgi:uncharacterized protein YwgA
MVIINFRLGKVREIERLKSLLLFIMRELHSVKYKTELVKLCFILDYRYCQNKGGEVGPTTVEYVKYNYGPYSDAFKEAFESLSQEGLIIEKSLPFGEGFEIVKEVKICLPEEVTLFAKKILEEYGEKSLREMKEYIYNLEVFKNTAFGQTITLNING